MSANKLSDCFIFCIFEQGNWRVDMIDGRPSLQGGYQGQLYLRSATTLAGTYLVGGGDGRLHP